MKHLLSTVDLDPEPLEGLIQRALAYKRTPPGPLLSGKRISLVFFQPSLRTRVSMEVASRTLGMESIPLDAAGGIWKLEWREGIPMLGDAAEHIRDAAQVLSRYVHAIGVRCFASGRWEEDRHDPILSAFRRHAAVPVINLESALWHPLQALADLMTIRERFGSAHGRRITLAWCYHPKALPTAVPNSLARIALQSGMELTVACPLGYTLPESCVPAGRYRQVHDLHEGLKEAEIVYAKGWGPTDPALAGPPSEKLRLWRIDREGMNQTGNGVFMHCLPIRRNVIATDEVIDDPRALVYHQAENRLYVQQAVLTELLRSP
jgi:N-acetylornithine carbamoyltransferase